MSIVIWKEDEMPGYLLWMTKRTHHNLRHRHFHLRVAYQKSSSNNKQGFMSHGYDWCIRSFALFIRSIYEIVII